MNVTLQRLPAGTAGTKITLQAMQKFVRASLQSQKLRLLTLTLLRDSRVDSHKATQAARAIFYWVRSKIQYVNDPIGIETVQSPEITLQIRAGDCDDHATLVAAMAMSIGIPTRFVVIGPDPENFGHVYTELKIDGSWLPADTTRAVDFGSPAPDLGAKKVFELSGKEGIGMSQQTVTKGDLANALHEFGFEGLTDNWRAGKIDRNDLLSYLRVIDEGNAPFEPDPVLKELVRKTIADYVAYVDMNRIQSRKSTVGVAGLEGLDGFFSSVWGWVKGAVNWVFGKASVTVSTPGITYQSSGATQTWWGNNLTHEVYQGALAPNSNAGWQSFTSESSARVFAGVNGTVSVSYYTPSTSWESILSNPLVLVGGALVLVMLLKD
jgi:hypothetical protein